MSGFFRDELVSTPQEAIRKINEPIKIEKNQYVKATLPNDFTSTIPEKGLAWLNKYDITEQEISKYGIGYSNRYNRVVIPFRNINGLLG